MTRENAPAQSRRKNYLVLTKYQLKYIALIMLFMLLTMAVCIVTVYFSGMAIFAAKLSSVYPQSRIAPLINMVNFRVFANIMLVIPVVGVIGVFLSHKLAGPILRVESYLSEMASGKLTARIKVRKGDELVSLADRVNDLTDSLRDTIESLRNSLGRIVSEIESVKHLADSRTASVAEIDSNIDRIEEELRALKAELDRFTT